MQDLINAPVWILLPLIFLSRIADQSLSTMRTISIFKGFKLLAALIGFVEVLIWINVAGQVIRNIDTWYLAVVYAAGFAAGNAVGLYVESRIAFGYQTVRAWSRKENRLAETLWEKNYSPMQIDGQIKGEAMDVIIVAEKRKNIPALCRLITESDADAFYTIEDVKQVGLIQRDPAEEFGRKIWSEMTGRKQ